MSAYSNIFQAAAIGTVDDVRYFVETKYIDVNAKNNDYMTPLHVAAGSNPNVAVLKYLIDQGADVNARGFAGYTPLHCASLLNSNVEVLRCLIDGGADVNAKNCHEAKPRYVANTEEKRCFLLYRE